MASDGSFVAFAFHHTVSPAASQARATCRQASVPYPRPRWASRVATPISIVRAHPRTGDALGHELIVGEDAEADRQRREPLGRSVREQRVGIPLGLGKQVGPNARHGHIGRGGQHGSLIRGRLALGEVDRLAAVVRVGWERSTGAGRRAR